MSRSAKRFIQNSFTKGSVFDGKYRIDELIGTGNFSHVFRARHESMDRDVAIKILKPEMKDADPGLSVRFINEVKVVSRLHHPNSVTIFDFGETQEGIQYMVLEYIPGIDLDVLLEKRTRFSEKKAIHLIVQVLGALEEAHRHNIIHRDLKPSNIMITKNANGKRVVKVLDFGVAKFVDKRTPNSGTERRSTQFIGTPVYMSPEQVLGQSVSPSSDLYSVGLILYELLTGDVPIVAKNLAGVARIHIDEAPIPFKRIKDISHPMRKIILKATNRFPEDRFHDAKSFSRALLGLNAPKSTRKSEVSESTRAFFLDREAEAVPLMERTKSDKGHEQRAKRVKRPTIPAPQAKIEPRPSPKTLQLDIQRIRAVDRARQNKPVDTITTHKFDIFSMGLGISSLFLCAFFWGSFAPTESIPLRFLFAFTPVVIGLIAVSFSSGARRHSGTLNEKWLEPLFQKSIPIFFTSFLVSLFVFPEHAALSMRDQASWFLPETLKTGFLGIIFHSLGSAFAALFSFASQILPW